MTRMFAARILHIPLSGRDRRHYAAELRKAENAYRQLTREAAAAHETADRALAEAHRLDCEIWSTRQFLGGPDASLAWLAEAGEPLPSPVQQLCRICAGAEPGDQKRRTWYCSR